MAFGIWIHLVLVVGLSLRRSETAPGLKLKRDCSAYSVGNIRVEVKSGRQGRKAWRQIENSQTVPVENSSLAPLLDPQIRLGDESNLNIVWKDKKLARRYLLRLETQYGKRSKRTAYILLKLRHRRRIKDKDKNMHFPCIELTKEPNTILIVEIWPLSSGHARNSRDRTDRIKSNLGRSIGNAIPLPERRSIDSAKPLPERRSIGSAIPLPERRSIDSAKPLPERRSIGSAIPFPERRSIGSAIPLPERRSIDSAKPLPERRSIGSAKPLPERRSIGSAKPLPERRSIGSAKPLPERRSIGSAKPLHERRSIGSAIPLPERRSIDSAKPLPERRSIGSAKPLPERRSIGSAIPLPKRRSIGSAKPLPERRSIGSAIPLPERRSIGSAKPLPERRSIGSAIPLPERRSIDSAKPLPERRSIGSAKPLPERRSIGSAIPLPKRRSIGSAKPLPERRSIGSAIPLPERRSIGSAKPLPERRSIGSAIPLPERRSIGSAIPLPKRRSIGSAIPLPERRSIGSAKPLPERRSIGSAKPLPERRSIGSAKPLPKRRSIGSAKPMPERRSIGSAKPLPERRSIGSAKPLPERRSIGSAKPLPERRSIGSAIPLPKRRSIGSAKPLPKRRSIGSAKPLPERRSIGSAKPLPERRSIGSAIPLPKRRSIDSAKPLPERRSIGSAKPMPERRSIGSAIPLPKRRSIDSAKPLPERRSIGSAIPLPERRSRKSVAGETICRNILGQVQCSVPEVAALSLEHYIPYICHCAKPPSVQLDGLKNGSLVVRIGNLPQYAYNIDVKIRVELIDEPAIFHNTTVGTTRVNETRTLYVEGRLPPGNYVATVRANCAGEAPAVGTDCSLTGTEQSNILEVKFESSNSVGQANISLLAGILAVIVASTVVTLIVLCKTKCRPRHTGSSKNLETEVVSLDSTRYQHGFTETTGYQSNSVRLPVNYIFDDNPDSAKKLSDDEQRVKTLRTLHSEESSLNVFKKNREKMFLYHPDNPEHENKIDKFRNVLHARDIILCNDKYDNWRDFAETAGKELPEIVIILSEGLLKLCKAYENKANGHDNEFDVLRQQRNYEYTPCVAMKKLQTLIQENPDSCPFSLHLVSFECDNDLFEDFRNLYDCLKRTSCCAYYNLYISTSNITEQKVHRRNLKRLIKALNGLH